MVPTRKYRIMESFLEDALNNIDKMQELLKKVFAYNFKQELVDEFYRLAHNMKGSAAILDFQHTSKIAKLIVDTIKMIRQEGSISFDTNVRELFIALTESLKKLIINIPKGQLNEKEVVQKAENYFSEIINHYKKEGDKMVKPENNMMLNEIKLEIDHIKDVLKSDNPEEVVENVYLSVYSIRMSASMLSSPEPEELCRIIEDYLYVFKTEEENIPSNINEILNNLINSLYEIIFEDLTETSKNQIFNRIKELIDYKKPQKEELKEEPKEDTSIKITDADSYSQFIPKKEFIPEPEEDEYEEIEESEESIILSKILDHVSKMTLILSNDNLLWDENTSDTVKEIMNQIDLIAKENDILGIEEITSLFFNAFERLDSREILYSEYLRTAFFEGIEGITSLLEQLTEDNIDSASIILSVMQRFEDFGIVEKQTAQDTTQPIENMTPAEKINYAINLVENPEWLIEELKEKPENIDYIREISRIYTHFRQACVILEYKFLEQIATKQLDLISAIISRKINVDGDVINAIDIINDKITKIIELKSDNQKIEKEEFVSDIDGIINDILDKKKYVEDKITIQKNELFKVLRQYRIALSGLGRNVTNTLLVENIKYISNSIVQVIKDADELSHIIEVAEIVKQIAESISNKEISSDEETLSFFERAYLLIQHSLEMDADISDDIKDLREEAQNLMPQKEEIPEETEEILVHDTTISDESTEESLIDTEIPEKETEVIDSSLEDLNLEETVELDRESLSLDIEQQKEAVPFDKDELGDEDKVIEELETVLDEEMEKEKEISDIGLNSDFDEQEIYAAFKAEEEAETISSEEESVSEEEIVEEESFETDEEISEETPIEESFESEEETLEEVSEPELDIDSELKDLEIEEEPSDEISVEDEEIFTEEESVPEKEIVEEESFETYEEISEETPIEESFESDEETLEEVSEPELDIDSELKDLEIEEEPSGEISVEDEEIFTEEESVPEKEILEEESFEKDEEISEKTPIEESFESEEETLEEVSEPELDIDSELKDLEIEEEPSDEISVEDEEIFTEEESVPEKEIVEEESFETYEEISEETPIEESFESEEETLEEVSEPELDIDSELKDLDIEEEPSDEISVEDEEIFTEEESVPEEQILEEESFETEEEISEETPIEESYESKEETLDEVSEPELDIDSELKDLEIEEEPSDEISVEDEEIFTEEETVPEEEIVEEESFETYEEISEETPVEEPSDEISIEDESDIADFEQAKNNKIAELKKGIDLISIIDKMASAQITEEDSDEYSEMIKDKIAENEQLQFEEQEETFDKETAPEFSYEELESLEEDLLELEQDIEDEIQQIDEIGEISEEIEEELIDEEIKEEHFDETKELEDITEDIEDEYIEETLETETEAIEETVSEEEIASYVEESEETLQETLEPETESAEESVSEEEIVSDIEESEETLEETFEPETESTEELVSEEEIVSDIEESEETLEETFEPETETTEESVSEEEIVSDIEESEEALQETFEPETESAEETVSEEEIVSDIEESEEALQETFEPETESAEESVSEEETVSEVEERKEASPQTNIMAELTQFFLMEAYEYLEKLNNQMLEFEKNPDNNELITSIMKIAHTLKGSSAISGFNCISKLSHKFEDLFDVLKTNLSKINSNIIDAMFETLDIIQLQLKSIENGRMDDIHEYDGIMNKLEKLIKYVESEEGEEIEEIEKPAEIEEIETDETLEEKTEVEDKEIDIPELAETETVEEEIIEEEKTDDMYADVEEAIEGYEEDIAVKIDEAKKQSKQKKQGKKLVAMPEMAYAEKKARLAEKADKAGLSFLRVGLNRLDKIMNLTAELVISKTRLNEILHAFYSLIDSLEEDMNRFSYVKKQFDNMIAEQEIQDSFLKSTAAKSDFLEEFSDLEFDRFNQMHVIDRDLRDAIVTFSDKIQSLNESVTIMEQNSNELSNIGNFLQEEIMNIRMVPIATLFQRFPRYVRDIAKENNKQVKLVLRGEDTNIDKTVIEKLNDPFVHLIRNAIDHGIEKSDFRKEMGKDEEGTIIIEAKQQGNRIIVEIEDDGCGIDITKIKEKAINKELITEEEANSFSDSEILSLIFEPNFSTTEKVTKLSGRGVGMDVVRDAIADLKGSIKIESELGYGTKITFFLPLTLVIAPALMVKISSETFSIPITNVVETARIAYSSIATVSDKQVVKIRGQILPLVRMDQLLGLPSIPFANENEVPIVIVSTGVATVALLVNDLLGSVDIVIKGMGSHLRNVNYFSGATITGDGTVVLILEVAEIINKFELGRSVKKIEVRKEAKAEEVKAKRKGLEYIVPSMFPEEKAPTILAVDDSISIRKFISNILKRAGYNVLTAADGFDALSKLNENKVDLILTDLEMPRMHGYELIAEIKKKGTWSSIPIVILTARAGEKHRKAGLAAGANAFLVKPFDEKNLLKTLGNLVYQNIE